MNALPEAFTVRGVDFREKIMPIYQCISPEGLLGESAPNFRPATSKHATRTASLVTKSRIRARMS
jgi:hypothetical protein